MYTVRCSRDHFVVVVMIIKKSRQSNGRARDTIKKRAKNERAGAAAAHRDLRRRGFSLT